jgi:hypothetical protein
MSLHSSMSYEAQQKRIDRDQTGEAVQTPYVIDRTAEVLASLQAWHAENDKPAGLPMDAVLDALNELANMTAEEEALLNQIILDEEAGL